MEWFIRPLVFKPLTITIYASVSGTIDHVSGIICTSYKLLKMLESVNRAPTTINSPQLILRKLDVHTGFLYCIIYLANIIWGGANFTHAISQSAESSLWWQHFFANPSSPLPTISISHAPCYTINSFQMFPAKVIGFQLAVTHLICSRIFSFQPQFDKSENDVFWFYSFPLTLDLLQVTK